LYIIGEGSVTFIVFGDRLGPSLPAPSLN
jgi:hypothetical protein